MRIDSNAILDASTILANHPARITNSYGNPGGLVDLTNDTRSFLIIGDLHAAYENLKAILEHNDNKEKIQNGEMMLIILGDCIHNDQTGEMLEMESSVITFELLIEIILELKDNVIYIRGNHDTFDERLGKSGIKQGMEFKKYLEENKEQSYFDAVEHFFNHLPMLVITDDSIITHAGPIRNGASRQAIIDIEDNPDYYHQLMWNRLHEIRGTPSLKEYDEQDINKMRKKLGLPQDCYFIVGHNPMWQSGNLSGTWIDIIGIKNHIILYANKATRGAYIIIKNGLVSSYFAIPEQKESFYVRCKR